MPQYWDDVLYPQFRSFIRGEYYGIISQDNLDEDCYYLACRAINAFKFPKISTDYTTFYAVRVDGNILQEADESDTELNPIPHAYFNNDITFAEIDIIIAWMKVYWCEQQISNADNFEEIYTDANIKTYSRANAVDKNMKLMAEFRDYAKDLENRYSRVTQERKPSLGDINSNE